MNAQSIDAIQIQSCAIKLTQIARTRLRDKQLEEAWDLGNLALRLNVSLGSGKEARRVTRLLSRVIEKQG